MDGDSPPRDEYGVQVYHQGPNSLLQDYAHDLILDAYGEEWATTSLGYPEQLSAPIHYITEYTDPLINVANPTYIYESDDSRHDIGHQQQHHFSEPSSAKCANVEEYVDVCGGVPEPREFVDITHNRSQTQNPRRRFCCAECEDVSYSRQSDLNRHMKEKHENVSSDMATVYCPYCSTTFTRKQNCQRHLKRGCELAPVGVPFENLRKPMTGDMF